MRALADVPSYKLRPSVTLLKDVQTVLSHDEFRVFVSQVHKLKLSESEQLEAAKKMVRMVSPFPDVCQQLKSFSSIFINTEGYEPSHRQEGCTNAQKCKGYKDKKKDKVKKKPKDSDSTEQDHEQALFECEDEQFELDRRICLLESAMKMTKAGKSLSDWEKARLARAFDCDKSVVEDFVSSPDAVDLLSTSIKNFKDVRHRNKESWREIYQEHYWASLGTEGPEKETTEKGKRFLRRNMANEPSPQVKNDVTPGMLKLALPTRTTPVLAV